MNTEPETAVTPEATVTPEAIAHSVAKGKQLTADIKAARQYIADCKAAVKAMPAEDPNIAAGKDATEKAEAALAELVAEQAANRASTKQLREDLKAAKDALKAEKAAAKEAAAQAAKVERVTQNGMTQPLADSISGQLWAIYDSVSAAKGAPAAFAEVLEPAQAAGIKEATTRAAYAHWRKFHGVSGRVLSVEAQAAAEAKAQADAAKAAAKAQAEADKVAAAAAAAQAEASAEA